VINSVTLRMLFNRRAHSAIKKHSWHGRQSSVGRYHGPTSFFHGTIRLPSRSLTVLPWYRNATNTTEVSLTWPTSLRKSVITYWLCLSAFSTALAMP